MLTLQEETEGTARRPDVSYFTSFPNLTCRSQVDIGFLPIPSTLPKLSFSSPRPFRNAHSLIPSTHPTFLLISPSSSPVLSL